MIYPTSVNTFVIEQNSQYMQVNRRAIYYIAQWVKQIEDDTTHGSLCMFLKQDVFNKHECPGFNKVRKDYFSLICVNVTDLGLN